MRSFSIVILFTVFSIAGIAFLPLLPVQLNPSGTQPSLSITYNWPGASARIIEKKVTGPLEAALGTLSGLTEITSNSSNGKGSISIFFDKYTQLDNTRFEAAMLIRQLYSKFPPGLSYPELYVNMPNNESNKPLLIYQINASDQPYDIQQWAQDNIVPAITEVKGTYKTVLYGAQPYEWTIRQKKTESEIYNVNPADITQAVQHFFRKYTPGSTLVSKPTGGTLSMSITVNEKVNSNINWNKISIKNVDGRIIYLTDIATVDRKTQQAQTFYRINGLNAVNLVVYTEQGANQLHVAQKISSVIQALSFQLPKGYTITESYNSTTYIKDELDKITFRTYLTIGILLLFVFIISRQVKYVMHIICSLIATISIAFCLYYVFRIEIHLYSLAGITVSLGLLIDNSIVMIDHIKFKGNRHVFLALFASTLTTVASLTIIYFLPDQHRLNLLDFAKVIIINLSVSLFVALFFIPGFNTLFPLQKKIYKKSRLKRNFKRKKRILLFSTLYDRSIRFFIKFRLAFIFIAILGFGVPVFWLPNTIEGDQWYCRVYNSTLGNETYCEHVKPVVNKILGGSLRLFTHYVFESSFYGKPEETVLYARASLPEGTSVQQANDVFIRLENFLSKYEGLSRFVTQIKGPQNASMAIYFEKGYELSSLPYNLYSELIDYSLNFDGIDWNVYGVGDGFNNLKSGDLPVQFSVALYGYNYDELTRQAEIMKEKILSHPRVQKAEILGKNRYRVKAKYEYVFKPDLDKLAANNITPGELYNGLNQISGQPVQIMNIIYRNTLEPVLLKTIVAEHFDTWGLQNIPFATKKLKSTVAIEKRRRFGDIDKMNQQYIRTIKFDYTGTFKFGNKHLDKVIAQMEQQLPMGYTIKKQERYMWFNQDMGISYSILLLVFACVYFICAILFESLLQPLAVIAIIPLSFIGVFLTFYCFDFNFDQGGYASFILLCGISVNSVIYIINEMNNIRRGVGKIQGIKLFIKAFNGKIIPVLLTILSTILGMLPFLIGGQKEVFWFALAAGTTGGLIFSIIAIFIYLPLFMIKKIYPN